MYVVHHTLDARMWTNNFRRWDKLKYEMYFSLCGADENWKWLQVGNANIDDDYLNVLPTERRSISAQKLSALIFVLRSLIESIPLIAVFSSEWNKDICNTITLNLTSTNIEFTRKSRKRSRPNFLLHRNFFGIQVDVVLSNGWFSDWNTNSSHIDH